MSEYIIDGTLLSNIAREIRRIDGTTANLTPEQMQVKLMTIKTSVDGALNQVKNKGVTVPSGSDVHDLASLIAKIKTYPSSMSKFTYGSYTPTSNNTDVTITHGLGVEPDFFILTSVNGPLSVGSGNTVRPVIMDYMYSNHMYDGTDKIALLGGRYSTIESNGTAYNPTITTSTIVVRGNMSISYSNTDTQAGCLVGGEVYRWMAGVWA